MEAYTLAVESLVSLLKATEWPMTPVKCSGYVTSAWVPTPTTHLSGHLKGKDR